MVTMYQWLVRSYSSTQEMSPWKNHTIIINDDNEREKDPNENVFSNIALNSGIPDITVTVPRAMVTIDDIADSTEPECGKIAKKNHILEQYGRSS